MALFCFALLSFGIDFVRLIYFAELIINLPGWLEIFVVGSLSNTFQAKSSSTLRVRERLCVYVCALSNDYR